MKGARTAKHRRAISVAMKAAWARRGVVHYTCRQCGSDFRSRNTAGAMFCSRPCAMRAAYLRRVAAKSQLLETGRYSGRGALVAQIVLVIRAFAGPVPLTVAEAAEVTSIPWRTLYRILEQLMSAGVPITPVGRDARKAIRYRILAPELARFWARRPTVVDAPAQNNQ